MQSTIVQLQLMLTEACCFRCPDCCCQIPRIQNPRFMPVELIERIAPFSQGLDRIGVAGGEPLLHPQFGHIASHLKEWFHPNRLWMCTNAVPSRWDDSLDHFDYIVATHYTKASYANSGTDYEADNTEAIERLRKAYHGQFFVNAGLHHSRQRRMGSNPCDKATNGDVILFPDGLLYPCCVGAGIDGAIGIPMTERWREEIRLVPTPCSNCFFAVP